jgi:adenylate cyclase
MKSEDQQPTLLNLADGSQHILSDVTIFGRKSDSAVHLVDTRVSRRHAMIRSQEGGQYWFYDLGSFNGSYINDERVTATRQLEANDVIRICDHQFRFLMLAPGQSPTTPEWDVQTVPMLILVSDIKGFTRLSEMIPHEELAQAIGSWYDYCTEILTEHGAAIDKFIGDAVLAYWTDVSPNARKWAVMAARELRRGCEEIGEQLRYTFERYGGEFGSGVGLHSGDVAYGQFGHGGLTMLGDAVNTTFRIQAATRTLGHDVLVSGDFFEPWPEGLRYTQSLGIHELKGRQVPVELFALDTTPTLLIS